MFGRFLPRSDTFFDFFEKQASIVLEAIHELCLLVCETQGDSALRAQRIRYLEHDADVNAHQCIEVLHKTFITPLERDDIYRLMVEMDDIIDFIDDAAERIVLYRLKEMTPEVQELAKVLLKASQEVELAVKGLRAKSSAEVMRKRFTTINALENEGDKIYRNAVGRLFDEEQDTRMLIKWKEVYENLENGIDCCEHVSHIIEGVILERD